MRKTVENLPSTFSKEPAATVESIARLKETSPVPLPEDYLEFLSYSNGGAGSVGEEYFILWRAEEITRNNEEYEVNVYAPDLFFFGSDGGGNGYVRSHPYDIVDVPFIGMSLEYTTKIANNFTELLNVENKRGQTTVLATD